MLDVEDLAVLLDIGYSPAMRDPALRDGLLDIESLAVLLDIGYSPAMRDPARCGTGYWVFNLSIR